MQAGSGIKGLHHVMRNALIVSAVILAALGIGLAGASATRAIRPAAAFVPPAPAFQP